MTENEVMLKKH